MHLRHAGLAAITVMLLTATPAAAAAPQVFSEPIFSVVPDVSNDLVVFWNISREAYCAWETDGFSGPPPAIEDISGQFQALPSGPVVARFAATRDLELWRMDSDATLAGPCEDTDDSAAPWAVGSAHVSSTNNDVLHWESADGAIRANSVGESGTGTVVDGTGERHEYHWGFRAVDRPNGSARAVEHSTLTP